MDPKNTKHNEEMYGKFLKMREGTKFCDQMEDEQAKMFMTGLMIESLPKEEVNDTEILALFSSQITLKRVEALALPISFHASGLVAMAAITSMVPGRVVSTLIDCLIRYEGKEVKASDIVDLYPFGFYKEEVWADYVDNVLKERQISWSWLY